jgi:hypothetical protein
MQPMIIGVVISALGASRAFHGPQCSPQPLVLGAKLSDLFLGYIAILSISKASICPAIPSLAVVSFERAGLAVLRIAERAPLVVNVGPFAS